MNLSGKVKKQLQKHIKDGDKFMLYFVGIQGCVLKFEDGQYELLAIKRKSSNHKLKVYEGTTVYCVDKNENITVGANGDIMFVPLERIKWAKKEFNRFMQMSIADKISKFNYYVPGN